MTTPAPAPLDLPALLARATTHYQPIVDLSTSRLFGAEALIRFRDGQGVPQSPAGIIDRIEEDLDLTAALIRKLFEGFAQDIRPLFDHHRDFYISVNIPPTVIGSGRLRTIFQDSGLSAYSDRFVLELTERQALCDAGREAVIAAQTAGIRIAMDDFGVGHSGLKQLIGLPLHILKLDKSQIDPLMKDPTADRLLRGIVALAAALRVKVVAEGVETREQAFFLRAAGVDAGQGWFWSKAVPAAELEPLLEQGFPDQLRWA
jgi:sensor c-di-GMP phosphodiesterase-like protein